MMKLLLLHGPGIINSRNQLNLIKKQFSSDGISTVGDKFSLSGLINNLITPTLFSDKRLVILENPPEETDYTKLPEVENLTLVLWINKELSIKSKVLSFVKLKKGEIKFYPEKQDTTVFSFLDSLGGKDKQAFIELNKLKSHGIDTHYLITMVYYLLRNLVCIPQNAPDFVKKKLELQNRNFSSEELISLYKFVLTTDFKLKTGFIEKDQAEFLLIQKFLKI